MSNTLPFSQACENNKQPILEVLADRFTLPTTVLEIGAGTGQHAEHFARQLPHLTWIPTNHPDSLWMCQERVARSGLDNVRPPRALDVGDTTWDLPPFDHAYSANTAHIMAWKEVEAMFKGVGERVAGGGFFCLYGPFNYYGEFTSTSNRQFDQHLRSQAPHMGIRDLDDIKTLAIGVGLELVNDMPMPANNRLLVFSRIGTD